MPGLRGQDWMRLVEGNQVSYLLYFRRTDPRYGEQIIGCVEETIGRAMIHDLLRQAGSNPREQLEFRGAGGIDIDHQLRVDLGGVGFLTR